LPPAAGGMTRSSRRGSPEPERRQRPDQSRNQTRPAPSQCFRSAQRWTRQMNTHIHPPVSG
jgi:hypothetical protein